MATRYGININMGKKDRHSNLAVYILSVFKVNILHFLAIID